MPRLVGPATNIYNYVLGGFGEIRQKETKNDWQQLLAQVPIFKKKLSQQPPESPKPLFLRWGPREVTRPWT